MVSLRLHSSGVPSMQLFVPDRRLKMRDPTRIDEMLDLLRQIWTQEPDLRLGQLVFNAARMRTPEINDIYSIEDAVLVRADPNLSHPADPILSQGW